MEEKLKFVSPSLEIIAFPKEDIITTSGGVDLPDHEW